MLRTAHPDELMRRKFRDWFLQRPRLKLPCVHVAAAKPLVSRIGPAFKEIGLGS
jgi:hypothetical protein